MVQATRTERKSKRRKTNRVLNTAIAVVVLLIIVVAFTIFSGGKDEAEQPADTQTENSGAKNENNNENNNATDIAGEEKEEDKQETEDKEEKEEDVIVQESDEPNVEEEIVDPNWTGVGTSQTGTHSSSFDSSSVDWQEKLEALSYATSIPVDSMVVWYISGNGADGAIGTVSPASNKEEAYRVYINWVDGEGWTPEKVHKLIENDKGK